MPPKISRSKMRHILNKDLFDAMDLRGPDLKSVRDAVRKRGWKDAYTAWGEYFAERKTGRNLTHRFENRPDPATVIDDAERLVNHEIRYQGWQAPTYQFGERVNFNADWGQSGKYGFHYWFWSDPLRVAFAQTGDTRYSECFDELFNQWYEQRDDVDNTIPNLDVIFYELGVGGRNPQFIDHYYAYRKTRTLGWQTHERLLKTFLGGSRWLELLQNEGYRPGNWQLTGSLALVYCGGLFPEFRESKNWVETGIKRICEHADKDFYEDGCHSERAGGYGQVSLKVIHRLVDLADRNPHIRIPRSLRRRVVQAYDWFLATATPLGESLGFNDSGFSPLDDFLQDAVRLTGSGRFLWPIQDRIRSLGKIRPKRPSFTSIDLSPSGHAVMRAGWEKDDPYLVVNYGEWGGGHSHNDLLDFSMYAFGQPLALEATRWGSYDNPLNHYFKSPLAHNQVVVNDAPMDRENHTGEDVVWRSGKDLDYFSAKHRGYESEFGVVLQRRIVFVKPYYFMISDTILEASRHHAYTWYLHSPLKWRAGKRRSLASGRPGLQVVPAAPSEIRYIRKGVSYEEKDGVPIQPQNRYWIGLQKWISNKNQSSLAYDVALVPFRKNSRRVRVDRLRARMNGKTASVETARGVRIERKGRTDLIVYGSCSDIVECDNLRFKGGMCLLSIQNGKVKYVAVTDGGEVSYKGKTLVRTFKEGLSERYL